MVQPFSHPPASRRSLLRAAGGGIALTLAARGPGAVAQETTPAAAAPYRFQVGSLSVTAVSDGAFSFPIPGFVQPLERILFFDAPEQELAAVLRETGRGDWLDKPEQASEELAITPLVVDTGDELVLIDTGLGPAAPFPGTGQLLASLAAAGIDPGDIGTVVFTHAHADHVLGATDADGAPAFPNATVVIAKGEHDFWTSPERLAEVFADPAMA